MKSENITLTLTPTWTKVSGTMYEKKSIRKDERYMSSWLDQQCCRGCGPEEKTRSRAEGHRDECERSPQE